MHTHATRGRQHAIRVCKKHRERHSQCPSASVITTYRAPSFVKNCCASSKGESSWMVSGAYSSRRRPSQRRPICTARSRSRSRNVRRQLRTRTHLVHVAAEVVRVRAGEVRARLRQRGDRGRHVADVAVRGRVEENLLVRLICDDTCGNNQCQLASSLLLGAPRRYRMGWGTEGSRGKDVLRACSSSFAPM